MATITLTIPDAVAQRVLDAVAAQHGWHEGLGVTKAVFAKQFVIRVLKDAVRSHEGQEAALAAMATANANVDNDIAIT